MPREDAQYGAGRMAAPEPSWDAPRPFPLWARVAMTAGPMAAFGLVLAGTYLMAGHRAMLFLLGMAAGSFVGGGKLVILAGAVDGAPVGAWLLAAFVVFGDLATALFTIAVVPGMYRIPILGRRLATMRVAGFLVLRQHKWMRRAAWLGLAVFVAVPFQGTGAVLGVVLGRILGLSRIAVLTSIAAGSAAGASALAAAGGLGSDQITALTKHPVLGIAVVAASVSAMYLLGRWFAGQEPRQP